MRRLWRNVSRERVGALSLDSGALESALTMSHAPAVRRIVFEIEAKVLPVRLIKLEVLKAR